MPEDQTEPHRTKPCGPPLLVFPRLDLVEVEVEASQIDEIIYRLKSFNASTFDTERAAFDFYKQHLATHDSPVHSCSLGRHTTTPFTGPPLAQYQTAPAEDWVGVAVDFTVDHPIRCTLANDWQFGSITTSVNQKPSHKAVRRHPANPERELLEAMYDLEAKLYEVHPLLSRDALHDFWTSFEMHRHLTIRALKMQRFRSDYSDSRSKALDYVRAHIPNYVEDVLIPSVTKAGVNQSIVELAKKIQALKAESGATVEELEDLLHLDRKTIQKIERGEKVRPSTVDKALSDPNTLERLKEQLSKNRAFKRRRKRSM
jgi:DNA-binding XRE family transcriptional regulator